MIDSLNLDVSGQGLPSAHTPIPGLAADSKNDIWTRIQQTWALIYPQEAVVKNT